MPATEIAPTRRWHWLAAVVVVSVVIALRLVPMERPFTAVVGWFRNAGPWGALLFVGLHVGATTVSFPGLPFVVAYGYLYGFGVGFVLALSANTAAASLAFAVGRRFARRWAQARVRNLPWASALDGAIRTHGFRLVFLLRLSPLTPFAPLNYALAVSSISPRAYVLATVFGSVPGAIALAYLGSVATHPHALLHVDPGAGGLPALFARWTGVVATFVGAVLAAWYVRREVARDAA